MSETPQEIPTDEQAPVSREHARTEGETTVDDALGTADDPTT